MTSADPRRVYILRVASHILSLNLVEERLPNAAALSAFCEGRAALLVVTRLDQKGRVDVSNELKESFDALFRVIVYKTEPRAPLSADNYKSELNVITAHRNVDQALLGSLHQVFAKAASGKRNSSKLNVLVRQLEAEWGGSGDADDEAGGVDALADAAAADDGRHGRMSIETEQRFWARQAVTAADALAATYAEVLRLLAEKLTETESDSATDDTLFELIDVAEEALDTVWNASESGGDVGLGGNGGNGGDGGGRYTQSRMTRLIREISARLAAICAKRVARLGASIWSAADGEPADAVSASLQSVSTALAEWRECVCYLTAEAWPLNALNEWRAPPLDALSADFDLVERKIQKISSIRCFVDDLAALTSFSAASTSQCRAELFASIRSVMQELNPCVVVAEGSAAAEQQWSTQCAAVDRLLDGHVDALVPRLSAHLQDCVSGGTVDTILATLQRYERFLGQASVRSKLRAERENVVSALIAALSSATADRAFMDHGGGGGGKFLTEIAAQIIAVRGRLVQMENLRRLSDAIFADLHNGVQLKDLVASRQGSLKSAENEHFSKWCREMMAYANASDADGAADPSRSVLLRTTGRLMMLERERGRLTVSYGDRLALLLNEVRQLHALGLQIPSKILQCARAGERFYRYGVVLKQVAQFYNTIEHQMLPCQQAMMLDEALAFERLIIPPSASTPRGRSSAANAAAETHNVTWENPQQLSAYIEKLQAAADRLINHNRRLRQAHSEIGALVNELLEIDLVRNAYRWEERLLAIRQRFADEQRHAGAAANARAWALHWDRQLYKVLQVQFRWALESLSEQMPLIHTQLVLRDGALQLRPPLEELKLAYYKELNKFLLIPQHFAGIQPNHEKNSELYASILFRNADAVRSLYDESERIFDELRDVGLKFREWTSLWSVNFEELIEQHFQRAADWEAQYRHLKRKRRETDTIPNQISIGCVRVSMHSFKASVDESLKRVNDALVWTLRHSAVDQLQDIEQGLSEGIEKLSNLPQNLDEIADANQTHLALLKLSKKIRPQLETVEEKFEVLRDVFHTPDKVGDSQQQQQQNAAALAAVREQFARFETLLDGHEAMMRDQVELMKQNVAARVARLAEDCERQHALWNQFKPREELGGADGAGGAGRGTMLKAVEFVREKRQQFARLCDQRERIRNDCEQLELDVPDFAFLEHWQVELDEYEVNYLLYEDFGHELQALADQEWILFRNKLYLFDEFLQSWSDKLCAKDYVKTPVSVRLQKDIEAMKEFSSCLRFCRGEALSAEHWLEMFRTLKLPRGTTLEALKFGDLLGVQSAVLSNVERLKDLNARAHGEVTIREAIQELELWAAQAEFSLADYRHSSGSPMSVVREWKNVIAQVKDNQALLQSLRSSPYYKQFKDQTSIWEKRIVELDMCLHLLSDIQRKWVYLEPIFGRGALPAEAARFNRVDVEMRVILDDIAKDPRIVALCAQQSLARTLDQIADQLARCQRTLNEFLEEKRRAFPRFYFLGDDDLLEILGQSTNPTVIQAHLRKLFQGVDRVVFDTTRESIRAVVSAEGERVALDRPVRIVPQVETWLHQLSHELRNTLRRLVVECVQAQQALDPQKYPSQVLCVSEQIRFCGDVERCFGGGGGSGGGGPPIAIVDRLRGLADRLRSRLEEFQRMRVEDHVLRLKLKSLILDLVHHIDVVNQLLDAQHNDTLDCWTWQRQLRFYLLAGGEVVARQCGAEIPYTYEYQGNTANLVHTPLTDKCYLTLTQALSMGLGGNPYGPAGTGKTESVKALARLLGRQVLVFNCDEGIDVLSIGQIFVGLVQCGAWGCFDEFNRLEKNVLSAVSGQIQAIQDAIRCRAAECRLDGALDQRPVTVDANTALFVTMNPAGGGYGGRQRLPDNLKQLFRPVLMSAPDNELIAEILLYADGFRTAKALARKLVTAFNLSRDMLSAQQHYDWGLRAIKTVLHGCADAIAETRAKRRDTDSLAAAAADGGDGLTPERECAILLAKIQLNTMSKLTFADAQRFRALLSDIFPLAGETVTHSVELADFIRQAADKLKLKLTDRQASKIVQLHEQLRQRIGVVVVGACGVGKTTAWRVLADALALAGQPVRVHTLNPKCMPRNRLLGWMDADTREFSDGVLTSIAREVSKASGEPNAANSWIVCDGDIDPEWIEALNSVLDDNKLLTIPSGERIQFGSNVNFIFETCDLAHASPATVSRMGMIYMNVEDFDFVRLIDAFVERHGSRLSADFAAKWLPDILEPALRWTFEHPSTTPCCSRASVVHNVISHIQTANSLNQFRVAVFRGLWPHVAADGRTALVKQIIFNGVSIVDSALLDGSAANAADQSPSITNIYCDPRTDSLLFFTGDYGVSASERFAQTFTSGANAAPPLVQTARVQSARDTIRSWLDMERPQRHSAGHTAKGHSDSDAKEDGVLDAKRRHFIVYGEDGCGKEQLLRHCFSADRRSTVATLHCSAQTSAEHVEHLLAERCAPTTSGSSHVLRPRDADNLIVYLKSPNLIRPDRYGTSSLIAFLEQILHYGGFYDLHLDWIGVENVQFVLSVSDVRRSERFALPARFVSRLCCLSVECPDDAELTAIYTSYLAEILSRQNCAQRSPAVNALAALMIRAFARMRTTFQGDANATNLLHYTFTPLDLTNWVCSLTRHQLSEMDAATLYRCVVYEASRIFRDRLVSAEHYALFDAIVVETFGVAASTPTTERAFAPIGGVDARQLAQLSRRDYRAQLERAVARFEFEVANFNRTLDDELVDFCLALDRALTANGGSVLMAGRSAMDHDAAVRLVAHMHSIRVETLHVSGSYAMKHFVAELKATMQLAGVDDERVVLLVEDYQLVDSTFLQYLNAVIASGSMPGLYTQPEFDQHVAALRNAATSDPLAFDDSGGGGDGGAINFNAYFAKRVKRNLHVVVVMDVADRRFRTRVAANPSLYKYCTVLWRDKWSTSTLRQIADLSLRKRGIIADGTAGSKASAALGTLFAELFQSVPPSGNDDAATAAGQQNPAKFVVFLQNFFGILERKRSGVQERLKRLKAGVDKLTETRAAVSRMQKKAAKKSKILAEKQAEADRALDEITRSMTGANEQRAGMEDLRAATERENERIERQKRLIDEQLQQVEPLLKEAREAVGSIKADSLSEIRSLRAPPDAIRDILQAVLLFMGILDISWEAMRRFLAKSGVKDEIINFDARQIKPDAAKRVQALISSKSASFDPKNAKRASAAAAPLAAWVNANLQYSRILEKIAPLENERITLTKNLENAQSEMSSLSAGLDTLGQRVARLKQNFETLMKDATQIKVDLGREQATIEVAGTLVERLKSEFDRWQDQIVVLERELSEMEICCVISAAFVTFLGSVGQETRDATLDRWFRIVDSTMSDYHLPSEGGEGWSITRFRVLGFLASESEQIQWKEHGVTATNAVLESVAVMFNHIQCVLLVDPSGRVTQFLVNFYRSGGGDAVAGGQRAVEVLSAEQSDLLTQIELGARFGKTLIVTDVTAQRGVEPALIPLLRRDYSSRGGRRAAVRIGAKSVDVDEANFRLFLCSRDEQLRLPEHVRSAVALVNFATTRSALSSQILGIVVRVRQPELERRSVQLTAETEAMRVQLLDSEQHLLNELANSEGSLLENAELLASLNASKENSERIHRSLAESQLIRRQIEEQRDAYRAFAQKCAELHFAVADLHALNPLYNFNVDELLRLLRKLFRRLEEKHAGGASNWSIDLERIYATLRRHMFELVSRAIFKADRLMFAMRYIHATSAPSAETSGRGGVEAAVFQKNEWEFFLGQLHVQEEPPSRQSSVQWLEESRRADVARLHAHLPTLYCTLNLEDASTWSEFLRVTKCECAVPAAVAQRLSAFQQVLVVQALRPDRLHSAMGKFVAEILGIKSLSDASTLDWHNVCAEMDDEEERVVGAEEEPDAQAHVRPVLILIGVGSADPSQELADVAAHRFGAAGHFHAMAMSGSGGAGSGGAVVDAIRRCASAGDWLCLNNVHLAADLAPKIRQELNALSATRRRSFRLWLVTEAEPPDGSSSTNSLPPTFVQYCVKLAYEAPPGLRSNVQRSLRQWAGAAADADGRSALRLRALVVLCWLHAVLQERRTFIPQGWLKFYEFCASDLRAAKHALEMLADASSSSTRSSGLNWEAFRGLMASTIYGGRIEYELDVRVLHAYLRQYFGDELARHLADDRALRLSGAGIRLPSLATLKDYLRWTDLSDGDGLLAQLPAGDDGDQLPALLDMPPNVAFGWELAQSAETIAKLRRLIPGASSAATRYSDAPQMLRDTWSRLFSPLLNHWKRLNKQRPPSAPLINDSTNDVAADDPFLEALRLERLFGNELVQRIHTSLSAISRVVRGGAAQPDDKCSALARQLIAHQVPLEWTSIWPSPRDDHLPADYLSVVMAKMTQIIELIDKSARKSPLFFDTNPALSAAFFFRPVLLFNALRQHSARRMKVGVDALCLSCRWSDASQSATTAGGGSILLTDLHVQGARLTGGELRAIDATRAASFAAAPSLSVTWTTEKRTEDASTVQIPVFADAQRTAFVVNVDVACAPKERDTWTIAGVALFTF